MPIPQESFFLAPGGTGTLQQRIQQMVTAGILSGRFRPGERLPSSRRLARHLGVSRITVTLAYTELVSNDYLSARGRSGYFVSQTAPQPVQEAPRADRGPEYVDWSRTIARRYTAIEQFSKPGDWRDYPYPFIYGQADPSVFDHQNWRLSALRALGKRDFEALSADYYERDDPMLIEYIVRTILPRRGISAHPEEVILTLGAQNALWMAAQLLLTEERAAALENPCYPGLRAVLAARGCRVLPVDVDDRGLPPEALPAGINVVFTAASHHSPTNATMPVDRRMALLERAAEEDLVIVEDDYEFEMSFLKSASPSLKSLDRQGRVIYVGSFSKSLFPGLRLGYLVGPEAFVREARALRSVLLRHPPGHIQRTAAHFLSLGHYDAHINKMMATYKRRRQVMAEAIAAEGLTPATHGEAGGSSFWMRAPEGIDTEILAMKLRVDGVLIEPGRIFFSGREAPRNYYRLAYSSIAAPQIPEGIARIGRTLARLA